MGILEPILILIILIFVLILCTWPISLPFLIIYIIKRAKNKKTFKSLIISNSNELKDVSESKLSGFDITDISNLKKYLYDIFYKFETAYNNVDYNTMYNLSTPKLYDLYHTNIVLNLKFDEKKIIDNIVLEKMLITDAYSSSNKQVITTAIDISYLNYTMKSDGKIVNGNPTKMIKERFEVIFIKNFDKKDSSRCPNCGANVTGSTCEYCNSSISSSDFRIDSIKKIV